MLERTRSRLLAPIGVIVAILGLLAPTISPITPIQSAAAADTYETFTGSVADFYKVPSPLASGAPGTLIRVQAVSSNSSSTTIRMMYHSVDGAGRDRAVTGKMTYPNATAPTAGWPVMTIANGTVGLGPQCALSRNASSVYDFGIGGVAVASDYIGEGPVGEVQAYMSRASEGHSVLDAVRAARNFADAHAGSHVVVLGGSQGGHGALSANELASSYAPELDVAGTVSLAPAAMFDRTYGPLDEIVTLVVTSMGVVGLSTEHPEIDLADYASPAGLAVLGQIGSQCTGDITSAVLGVGMSFYTHDPRTTEPARSIMLANDVGNVAAHSPVFLIQGTADPIVNPQRTADLFARMCSAGQVTDYLTVPGADHETVVQAAMSEIQAWLSARLQGEPAPDSCPRSPTTSTTVPGTTTPATTTPATTTPGTGTPATTVGPVVAPTVTPGTNPTTTLPLAPTPAVSSAGSAAVLPATGQRNGLLVSLAVAALLAGLVLVAATQRGSRLR